MKLKDIIETLKSGASYFSTGTGLVALAVGVVALFLTTPTIITIPIALSVGVIFAIYGVHCALKAIKKSEVDKVQAEVDKQLEAQKKVEMESERLESKKESHELLELTKELKKELGDVSKEMSKNSRNLTEEIQEAKYRRLRPSSIITTFTPVDPSTVTETQTSPRQSFPVSPMSSIIPDPKLVKGEKADSKPETKLGGTPSTANAHTFFAVHYTKAQIKLRKDAEKGDSASRTRSLSC